LSNFSIRDAVSSDAATLTTICFRSKSHWGYPQEYIDLWTDELTITTQMIESFHSFVAIDKTTKMLGFCLLKTEQLKAEIEALYIDPDAMGQGLGRLLLNHAFEKARHSGCTSAQLASDPNALTFYQYMGGVQIDEWPSDVIPGRALPVLRFELNTSKL
jgi:GNAT superfamily N-acetyltransferase